MGIKFSIIKVIYGHIIISLMGIVMIFCHLGIAMPFYKESATVIDFNQQDSILADQLKKKALYFMNISNYDSSNYYYRKASVYYENLYDWNKLIICYENIGHNYSDMAHRDSAVNMLNKALKICYYKREDDYISIGSLHNTLGLVYFEQGAYEKAFEYYDAALAVFYKNLDRDPSTRDSLNYTNISICHNNLGSVYIKKGEYSKAMEYYQQSLNAKLKFVPETHFILATTYNNIGSVFFYNGDYDNALEYFQKTLFIDFLNFGPDHMNIAKHYNNIGLANQDKGEYSKALEYLEKSLAIKSKLIGSEHIKVAITYNSIGTNYLRRKEYDNAYFYFDKSSKIIIKTFGENHYETAVSYLNLGHLFEEKGDNNNALPYYHKSISIFLNTIGNYHPHIGNNYTQLAEVYTKEADKDLSQKNHKMKSEKYLYALQYYQKALQSHIKEFNDTSIYANPVIPDNYSSKGARRDFDIKVNSKLYLLEALIGKADAFYKKGSCIGN